MEKKDSSVIGKIIMWVLIAIGATVVVNLIFGGWFSLLGSVLVVGFWVVVGYFLRGFVDRRRAERALPRY